jgi:UDP-N-acetylglucosamine--N-acetylmuramyl-(pentapeptide) pyrophosphoryl-undecaprenol N-acetylglucosamine transferase
MKIVITGGGTGGHFYPLIAVADKIFDEADRLKLLKPEIIYMADKPYNEQLLYRKGISFQKIHAGKVRRYFSLKNFTDFFKTLYGILNTFVIMISSYPDVVFTNGSYVSVPVLFSAKILGIPIFLHVSDAIPSRALLTAAKKARKISIAFPEAAEYLPKDDKKVALIGNPIQDELLVPLTNGAHEFLELDYDVPTIFVIGGSSGARIMNDAVVDALPRLLMKYNVIHQIGTNNFTETKGRSDVVIYDHPYKNRYKPYAYLEILAMRMSAGAADIVVSRAGAGSISEIAQWNKPSIVIPIPGEVSRDQEKNAFAYARFGATVVMKQANLSANLLISEIDRIIEDPEVKEGLIKGAKDFSRPDAATRIANEIIEIALSHEK